MGNTIGGTVRKKHKKIYKYNADMITDMVINDDTTNVAIVPVLEDQNTDSENLKLVSADLRPAYLWYPIKDRKNAPKTPKNLYKFEDIVNNKIQYWYTKNKDFIIPKTEKDIGKALGYIYFHTN